MSGTDPAMADSVPLTPQAPQAGPPRAPDLLTLAAGLGALGVAGTALLSGIAWLPTPDTRWVLAALALVVGLLLVISSLRHPRR
ncbi:MAG TPA: hypothetical protein VIY28_11825 [Pseudonocardiaceae bacterium]